MQETWVRSLGGKDPLEKEMATHSSILAWKIPWTEESMGSQSQTRMSDFTFTIKIMDPVIEICIGTLYHPFQRMEYSVLFGKSWGWGVDIRRTSTDIEDRCGSCLHCCEGKR